ncbi:hypothetical protein ACIOHO_26255 [Streptomyces sp. NPDC087849]|uniref:hypothetical protein n=1 Tax=Streptomyces sp. NPDC087849 TaxID=3365808 RepID=UPI0037FE9311
MTSLLSHPPMLARTSEDGTRTRSSGHSARHCPWADIITTIARRRPGPSRSG